MSDTKKKTWHTDFAQKITKKQPTKQIPENVITGNKLNVVKPKEEK